MAKVCPNCGGTDAEKTFYPSSVYCTECHNRRMVSDRKKPGRRERTNAYNNEWLKANPKANREAQRRFRERQRAAHSPWTIPPDRMTVQEAMVQLGVRSRFRITQLIDQGRLRAIKDHGQWLIVREDVERLRAERECARSDEDKLG